MRGVALDQIGQDQREDHHERHYADHVECGVQQCREEVLVMEQFDEVFESDEGSRTEQRGVGEGKPESVECRKDDEYKHNHERWQNKQVGGNDGAEATILLLAVVEVHRFRPAGGRAGLRPVSGECRVAHCDSFSFANSTDLSRASLAVCLPCMARAICCWKFLEPLLSVNSDGREP